MAKDEKLMDGWLCIRFVCFQGMEVTTGVPLCLVGAASWPAQRAVTRRGLAGTRGMSGTGERKRSGCLLGDAATRRKRARSHRGGSRLARDGAQGSEFDAPLA